MIIQKIKDNFSYVTALKLVLAGVLGLISKTIFIKLGLYYYATFDVRIRLPSEGVEIMTDFEDIFSSLLCFLIGLFYAIFLFFITYIYKGMQPENTTQEAQIISQIRFRLFVICLPIITIYLIIETFFKNCSWSSYLLGPFIFVLFSVFSATIRYRINFRYIYIGLASIALYFSLIISFALNFSYFLRFTKYGGGYKIIVNHSCEEKINCPKEEGFLVLRSKTYIYFFSEKTKTVKEIFNNDQIKIEYSPSNQTDWQLPLQ